MRQVLWAAGLAALVGAVAAAGLPAPQIVGAVKQEPVDNLDKVTQAFAAAVKAKAKGKTLVVHAELGDNLGARATMVSDRLFRDLAKNGLAAEYDAAANPKMVTPLKPGEWLAFEVTDPAGPATYRLGMRMVQQWDAVSKTMKTYLVWSSDVFGLCEYWVTDQTTVGAVAGVGVVYDGGKGVVIPDAPPKVAGNSKMVFEDQIIVEVNEWKKNGIIPRGLPVECVPVNANGAKGGRYKCPALVKDTEFVIRVTTNYKAPIGVDVLLNGKSSTEGAKAPYTNTKYLLLPNPNTYEIVGWLLEPDGVANGVIQPFKVFKFKVGEVLFDSPMPNGSKPYNPVITVAWYGAWQKGTKRSDLLPNPQAMTGVIVQGGAATTDLTLQPEHNFDTNPLGTITIEYGAAAQPKVRGPLTPAVVPATADKK